LLRLAGKELGVFITTDRGIPHQQNVSQLDLAVVLLRARSNAIEELAPLMERVNGALGSVGPETVPDNRSYAFVTAKTP